MIQTPETLPPPSTPSAAAIPVPPVNVPPALAKHPIILLVTAIAAIMGSVWVVSPTDNKAAIDAMDRAVDKRLAKIEQSQTTISSDIGKLSDHVQRHFDKHEARIDALERRMDGSDRQHDTTHRYMTDYSGWQQEVRGEIQELRRRK